MSLRSYKDSLVPEGKGFVNIGAICYSNSLLQCLLSLPSIYEVLAEIKDEEHVKKNVLAQNLMALHRANLSGQDVQNMNLPVWRNIMSVARARKDRVLMNDGQQDAHEGLMMFLDAVEHIPLVRQLFEHRHRIKVLCPECNTYVVDKREENLVFEVQPDLKTEQHSKFQDIDKYYKKSMPLSEFLRSQNGYVDENYRCPNSECNKKGPKFKTTQLTMVPEILPILIKKYDQKVITPFPSQLEFASVGGKKKMIFRLVAQSEHSGGRGGGHYWAIVYRKGKWVNLNDSSVSDTTPGPTHNTYVLFYHYDHDEDLSTPITTVEDNTPTLKRDDEKQIV